MTKIELKVLCSLLTKLRLEREHEIIEESPNMKQVFEDNDLDKIYEYDDEDNLIKGIDSVLVVAEDINGETIDKTSATKILETIYDELDDLQETDLFQEDRVKHGPMFFLGEAMGHIDNCMDELSLKK